MTEKCVIYLRVSKELKAAVQSEVERERGKHPKFASKISDSSVVRGILEGRLLKKKPKPKPSAGPKTRDIVDSVFRIWNESMPEHVQRPQARGSKRTENIMLRFKECGDLDKWRDAMRALASQSWHMGKNTRGWVANLDFLLQAKQFHVWLDAGAKLREHEKTQPSNAFEAMMEQARDEAEG